jgi:inorganic pyrophosphatase
VPTKSRLQSGQIVECEPVALMEQIEDGKEDHNVLAAIRGEGQVLDYETKKQLTNFVAHVFDHVPGKEIRVGGFRGRDAALSYIKDHQDRADSMTG